MQNQKEMNDLEMKQRRLTEEKEKQWMQELDAWRSTIKLAASQFGDE